MSTSNQNTSIRWCFSCMKYVSTTGLLCPVCGEQVTFNQFTPEQVRKYRALTEV